MVENLGVSLEVNMYRPAAIADRRAKLYSPIAIIEACQLRRIAGAESQRLDASDQPQFPLVLTDPAYPYVAVANQEPVVSECRIMKAGQNGIGDNGILVAGIRTLAA